MRLSIVRALMVGMVVAGGCTACDGGAGRAAPASATATTPVRLAAETSAPATSGAPTASGTPVVIPESVFLGAEHLPGARVERPSHDHDAYLRPPRPCGSGGESDAQRLAAARVHYLSYDPIRPTWPQRPTDLLHVVMVFEEGGAERYMNEFRDELRRCPQGVKPEHRYWKLVREGIVGDSVLATATPSSDGGGMPTRQVIPVLVARADNAVVVLADLGYESSAGDQQPLLDLAGPAVERARAAR